MNQPGLPARNEEQETDEEQQVAGQPASSRARFGKLVVMPTPGWFGNIGAAALVVLDETPADDPEAGDEATASRPILRLTRG